MKTKIYFDGYCCCFIILYHYILPSYQHLRYCILVHHNLLGKLHCISLDDWSSIVVDGYDSGGLDPSGSNHSISNSHRISISNW